MKKMRLIGYIISVIAMLMLAIGPMAGCGSKKADPTTSQTTQVKTTTKGQELQDLEAAHSKGIIDDVEYEKQKKMILEAK